MNYRRKISQNNRQEDNLEFPILKSPIREKGNLCADNKICPTCLLFKENNGPCCGCDHDYFKRCLKNFCYSNCNLCGGGRHKRVPAVCGRSPLRNEWAKIFEIEVFPYDPKQLEIKCWLIPVIDVKLVKFRIPERFPEIDAWAVPAHEVIYLKGNFKSDDLKDYLGLPKDRKLILTGCTPDKFTEMLWQKGDSLHYQESGIDFWFPANYSIYDNDSKFYQFFNAKRQQIHAQKVKSQFVWFRLGEHIPKEFLNPIRSAKSVLISCQQMYSARNRDILAREVKIADKWFSRQTRFFIISRGQLKGFSPSRMVYKLDSHWFMTARMGRTIKRQYTPKLSIEKLYIKNLKDSLAEDPFGVADLFRKFYKK